MPTFEQSIEIQASPSQVDRYLVEPDLMHQWLNPLLRCEAVGSWSVAVGQDFRFILQIPLLSPTLACRVVDRGSYWVEWQFTGFFTGSDRWECLPSSAGTLLTNCFRFTIPNPWVAWGFQQTAASWTKRDMCQQLERIKCLVEAQSNQSNTLGK
jgi:hypothetical protein